MKEGTTAQFELELSHENIDVSWYKNDVKIHPSRTVLTHVDGKRHVLELKEVTLDDTCQIKAEARGVPSMANLTVIGNAHHLPSASSHFCPVCHVCPLVSVLCSLCSFMFITRNPFFSLICVSFVTVQSFVCPVAHFWLSEFKNVSPFQRETRTLRLNSRTILLWRRTRWS